MNTTKILGVVALSAMLSGCMSHKHAVFFDAGSTKLSKSSKEVLMGSVEESKCPWKDITLIGYTDKKGNKKSNIKLADKRVDAVSAALISMGVKPSKIRKVASTEASIDNNANLKHARRVQLIIK
jgi:outer membrane protein OmpA-like peptidoglycan-associated protein